MRPCVLCGIIFIGITALLPLVSGCTALMAGGVAAGSAGAFAYEHGNYRGIINSPILECQKATIKAAENLSLVKLESVFLGTRSKFTFRNFQRIKFKVSLVRIDDTSTEATIRAGAWGNREVSRQFLSEIGKAIR